MLSLKYIGSKTLGSKDIGIGKSEFVAKTQFLMHDNTRSEIAIECVLECECVCVWVSVCDCVCVWKNQWGADWILLCSV